MPAERKECAGNGMSADLEAPSRAKGETGGIPLSTAPSFSIKLVTLVTKFDISSGIVQSG